jgi:hypothetical protein
MNTRNLYKIWITECDDDGEELFRFSVAFPSLDKLADYATEYHKGRLEYPGGKYGLTITRR